MMRKDCLKILMVVPFLRRYTVLIRINNLKRQWIPTHVVEPNKEYVISERNQNEFLYTIAKLPFVDKICLALLVV